MSFHVSLASLDEIHQCLMQTLIEDPDCTSAPRGKPIKELIAPSFTLMNPRNRLIMSPARSVNYGFAVGELCWYVRGDDDLATMLYYNKRMGQFSDDGQTINSAYGSRIFNSGSNCESRPSQWSLCLDELLRDPDSRRAVMHINQPGDLRRAVQWGSKDVPCTMSLQLFIRDRRLHMHVLMRSNDIVWGLPYDVFSFTMLQEMFMSILRDRDAPVDDLGSYHHSVGSLHVYDTHYEMGESIIKESYGFVPPMSPIFPDEIDWLAHMFEPACRESVNQTHYALPDYDKLAARDRDPVITTLDWMTTMLVDHRDKRVIERMKNEEKREH